MLDAELLSEDHFVASRFYHFDDLTWCVQKNQPIPIWRNFYILSSDLMVWIVCFPIFGTVTFMFYFLQQFENVGPKWNSFRIAIGVLSRFIGMSYAYKSTNNASRVLFAIGMFGCLIFVSSFISIMMTSLNRQMYADHVETIREILDSKFDLAGDIFSLQELLKKNEANYQIEIKCVNDKVKH